MKRILSILIAALTVIGLASCSGSGKTLLPNVSGKAGEVIVVIERADWEGALGNEVRDLLACDCPWLYIREPLYSLVNVAPGGFADLFKVHRNIVIFQIDPQAVNTGVLVKNDVWASPQCVVQVSAHDSEEAIATLKEKGATIVSAIEQAERDRVIRNTLLYEERPIAEAVNEIMGGSPHFPSGYKLKMKNDHFVWIADEKQYTTQGVFVYKYPVTKDDPFTLESIIAKRNEMLQENVPGMFENTYMTTAEYIAPTMEFIKYKGREFAQTRGYWEVYNDYMGGPFVSHSFYSPDGSEIIVTEAFVYAPRYDKRQYLRQVESLLYSFEWKKD
ncbi:MAG: DUF4837 family protein [Bacteroidales bacterium]|jgi:hypothetical protein|nr:DUF4837 family protein [Bacteroidales bacterium]